MSTTRAPSSGSSRLRWPPTCRGGHDAAASCCTCDRHRPVVERRAVTATEGRVLKAWKGVRTLLNVPTISPAFSTVTTSEGVDHA